MRFADRRGHRLARTVGTVACWAILPGCATPTIDAGAPPYDPTSLTAGALYHWRPGSVLAIHVVADDGGRLRATTHTAAARWMRALAYREQALRLVDRADAADIIVRHRDDALPVDTAGCGTRWTESAGSTLFCASGDTARTLALIGGPPGRTKVLITVNVAATADESELLRVLVHEIGHALGIGGHSDSPADVMFSAPRVAVPSRADERTLRYVLHRRPNFSL